MECEEACGGETQVRRARMHVLSNREGGAQALPKIAKENGGEVGRYEVIKSAAVARPVTFRQ